MSTTNLQTTDRKDWRGIASEIVPIGAETGSIHTRVSKALSRLLDAGVWLPGERIPGQRELAAHFGISALTANKSVATLEREGRLVRRGGRGGTVVAFPQQHGPLSLVVAMHCPIPRARIDYYSVGIMRGIQAALAQRGFSVSASFVDDWSPEELADLHASRRCGVLLVAPNEGRRQDIEALGSLGVPTVVVGASWPASQVLTVDCDNFQGVDDALQYLIRLGHSRIGCVYAWPDSSNHRDRLQAFKLFSARCGLQVHPDWVIEAIPSDDTENATLVCPALGTVLREHNGPTAMIATDYHAAALILAAAGPAGRDVPSDLSVITFDNPFPLVSAKVALTTLEQPLEEMGASSVERLIARLAGNPCAIASLLPMCLCERDTCSPARPITTRH